VTDVLDIDDHAVHGHDLHRDRTRRGANISHVP
jgi:hypothetical protein